MIYLVRSKYMQEVQSNYLNQSPSTCRSAAGAGKVMASDPQTWPSLNSDMHYFFEEGDNVNLIENLHNWWKWFFDVFFKNQKAGSQCYYDLPPPLIAYIVIT